MRLSWLGTLGGLESRAYGVALVAPVVVGWSYDASGKKRAFRWENDKMKDLGTLGGDESAAYAVSASGEVVVGWACDGSGRKRAFRWQSGKMQDLGTLGGDESAAYGISANGDVVVGWAEDHNKRRRAFYWQGGDMYDLGTLGGDNSEAYGVSAAGRVIVGWAEDVARRRRAFCWTTVYTDFGSMLDILNLGTLPEYDDHSVAWGVSENGGIVVGYAQNASGCPCAFRWNEKDGMGYLDLPRSGSQAYGVSRNGRLIVGVFDGRAVIWKPKDKGENLEMHKLNTRVSSNLARFSRLEVARAISLAEYSYYIVGWGYNSSTRRTEAFLLQQG